MLELPRLTVSWFSAGVSSFVATYLERDSVDKIIYIDIPDQHPDSLRFVTDCEAALGKPIEILKAPMSVDEICNKKRFISSAFGAACTSALKRSVRHDWEQEHSGFALTYIWGMDLDETNRAEALKHNCSYHHKFPLIERGLSKQDAHAILDQLGIKRPKMYDLGYQNNNCIGCVKGGMGYWNKIRVDFPEVFEQRAKMERTIGHSCINGVFLDELDPNAGRMQTEILQDCGIFCMVALKEEL